MDHGANDLPHRRLLRRAVPSPWETQGADSVHPKVLQDVNTGGDDRHVVDTRDRGRNQTEVMDDGLSLGRGCIQRPMGLVEDEGHAVDPDLPTQSIPEDGPVPQNGLHADEFQASDVGDAGGVVGPGGWRGWWRGGHRGVPSEGEVA